MKRKTFFSISAAIFFLIAILHVLRLIYGWEAVIGNWEVPFWVSWIALIIAGYVSYQGFQFSKKA